MVYAKILLGSLAPVTLIDVPDRTMPQADSKVFLHSWKQPSLWGPFKWHPLHDTFQVFDYVVDSLKAQQQMDRPLAVTISIPGAPKP